MNGRKLECPPVCCRFFSSRRKALSFEELSSCKGTGLRPGHAPLPHFSSLPGGLCRTNWKSNPVGVVQRQWQNREMCNPPFPCFGSSASLRAQARISWTLLLPCGAGEVGARGQRERDSVGTPAWLHVLNGGEASFLLLSLALQ